MRLNCIPIGGSVRAAVSRACFFPPHFYREIFCIFTSKRFGNNAIVMSITRDTKLLPPRDLSYSH